MPLAISPTVRVMMLWRFDAVGDRLADLDLGQVRVGLVEVEVLELEPRQRRLRRVRHLVRRLHDREVHRRRVEDVDLLVLQGRHQLAVVREELEDDLVELAGRAPVVRVADQDERLVRVVALDRVPAARDGLGRAGEAGVPADRPGDVGRDDVGEEAAPVGEGGLEGDGDGAAVRAQPDVAVGRAARGAGRAARRGRSPTTEAIWL